MRQAIRTLLVAAAVTVTGGTALAAGRKLFADQMIEQKVRVDGMLSEWSRGTMELKQTVSGQPGKDVSAAAKIGYDDKNVYVAMKVWDEKFVRTRGYGKNEDHAVLIIAFPAPGGGYTTEEVWLFAGEPGKSKGAVKRRGGGQVRGAKLVEAPMEGGYTFEAQIPWSTFRSARRWRVGLRGAVQYANADQPGKVAGVNGTSTASEGKALPPLLLESERSLDSDIAHNRLGKPTRELFGDVSGDGLIERVAVYTNYLTIVGPGYQEGKRFFYAEMGVPEASYITRFELRDMDGDGKDEIVTQKKLGGAETYREVLLIQKVGKEGAPEAIFTHDVAIVTPEGRIENKVSFAKGRRGQAITISQGAAEWSEKEVFQGAFQDDIPTPLLPWGTVGSRTFEWDGSAFKPTRETKQQPKKPQGVKSRPTREGPATPPPPRPPSSEELLEKVYALYRKDRKVKKAEPRFDFVTDVAADEQMERVLVHDLDIVVFGRGFLDGATYTYTTMGFADAKDVLDVTARDVTGDGKAEVVARGVLHAKAGEDLGDADVERHMLFIYKIVDSKMKRVFAAETGRGLGQNRVLAVVGFVPSSGGARLELRAGRALGWTQRTYPFPEDTESANGIAPLPLPWSEAAATYRFDGSQFTRE